MVITRAWGREIMGVVIFNEYGASVLQDEELWIWALPSVAARWREGMAHERRRSGGGGEEAR